MKQLTKEQAIILTGFTGIMMLNFGEFHEAVEKRLGHPVFTHQFGSQDFMDMLKELYREDFIKLAYKDESK